MAVVYGPDAFTVGANINLESYPSGAPDWVRVAGSDTSGELRVTATTDRVENTNIEVTTPNFGYYRNTNAAMPTGDQEVTADANIADASTNAAGILLRMPTDNADTGYLCRITDLANMEIFRRVAGVNTEIGTDAGTIAQSTTYTLVASASGTATVTIELFNGTTTKTETDSTGSRLESGTPGLHINHVGAAPGIVWMDNYQVDDMDAGGGGGGALPVHQYAQMMAA